MLVKQMVLIISNFWFWSCIFGTDPTERWHINDFKDYALKRFETGTGWTYTPISRTYINENTAWFDEELSNEKYGIFRGTGVLIKKDNNWLISQYNLLLPIPNDLKGLF